MPSLLSGSKLRTGGSGQFIKLEDAMPQLPPTPSTSTGYTIVTTDKLVSSYLSSLGNIEFSTSTVWSNQNKNIVLIATGTNTSIVVQGSVVTTSTNTGALVVQGGVGVSGNMFIGGNLIVDTFTATTATITILLNVTSSATSINTTTGALIVAGGVGIGENLNVGGLFKAYNTATFLTDVFVIHNETIKGEFTVDGAGSVNLNPAAGTVNIQPSLGGTVNIQPNLTGHMNNMVVGEYFPQDSHFLNSYANNFIGLATTATNIEKGDLGSIPYQTGTGTTAFIGIGVNGSVLTSNGTTATWQVGASIQVNTATNSINAFIGNSTGTQYLIMSTGTNNVYAPLADTTSLSYNSTVKTLSTPNLTVTNSATVIGSVYSNDGIVDEGNLLYTPRVTISTTAPVNPRIGDFWIDPTYGVELQYVNDGGNKFWVQFTGL